MKEQVQHQNQLSEEILVTSGVKQGYVMATTLFATYFAVVMRDYYCTTHTYTYILSALRDNSVFIFSKLQPLPTFCLSDLIGFFSSI